LDSRLPPAARRLIEERERGFSPIGALELKYLHETGRARDSLAEMLAALRRDVGLEVVDVSAKDLAEAAAEISWTRDPFDRLISAHAIVANAPLVTADETMLENLSLARWS